MKIYLTLGVAAFSIALLWLGIEGNLPTPWQGFILGLSGNFFSILAGLLIVNFYLENEARREAVKALFLLSEQSINKFHNEWLTLAWAELGKNAYGDLTKEYSKASGDPEALRTQDRECIYNIYKKNTIVQDNIAELNETLIELSRLTGWSLDARLLSACLRARTSILRLKNVTLDDSPESKTEVTKYLFEIDSRTDTARDILIKLAGLNQEE